MLSSKDRAELLEFAVHPRPFELLEIAASGKTLEQLFRELNHRAQDEFWEHCYRSKKNFRFTDFRKTDCYLRYSFLCRHLDQLTSWLYEKQEMPRGLQEARNAKPRYDNPWGLKEVPLQKKLRRNSFRRRKKD